MLGTIKQNIASIKSNIPTNLFSLNSKYPDMAVSKKAYMLAKKITNSIYFSPSWLVAVSR